MSGLYDRLTEQLGEADDKPAGISPLDIADLPEVQRRVMFALLRDTSASTIGLSLEEMQAKVPDIDDLGSVLAELSKNEWLIQMGEPPNVRYKVNIRRKRGSKQKSLWGSLADRLIE